MGTEEEKVKAEIDAADATLKADLAKAKADEANIGTWVKVHYVWFAGIGGALLGFILGHVKL